MSAYIDPTVLAENVNVLGIQDSEPTPTMDLTTESVVQEEPIRSVSGSPRPSLVPEDLDQKFFEAIERASAVSETVTIGRTGR
jgi:hypothetical protein